MWQQPQPGTRSLCRLCLPLYGQVTHHPKIWYFISGEDGPHTLPCPPPRLGEHLKGPSGFRDPGGPKGWAECWALGGALQVSSSCPQEDRYLETSSTPAPQGSHLVSTEQMDGL